jgi:hypothetical protein
VGTQPIGERVGIASLQQVDGPMRLQVDEQGAGATAAAAYPG